MEYMLGSMQYRCANKKLYITAQPAKVGAKVSTSKSPLGKSTDV